MQESLAHVLTEIRGCTLCADQLPYGPRPVVQAGPSARLRIIGQAPGRKVHTTGIAWDDPSGDRLRRWLDLTSTQFYDPGTVALTSMGFCYPGKARSGDKPPQRECAARWHPRLDDHLPSIALTVLVGQYAHAYYLGRDRRTSLTDTVRAAEDYLPLGYLPVPHPSPRNQPWLSKNPWFEEDVLPIAQAAVRALHL
ncbi:MULTISPECIES: uracil-DNA glycosylase family protein [Rhodococcus]|jgi:uracil-DNA glycosylase|uniref:uracil-DNA glycosylase family protein n=1 Tax=Rhodococcus TaxID=1827 RepID=UPI00031FD0B8|nr:MULTISPECIES: uracil-DNA glycosylase family protein [Rhodococcus]MCW0193747.1 uracil-DNA glycosylase family protein [Rhodococcus sp. (in: high G+C Gram-positive bacteria)]AKE01427.1 uracil-DNA glycosylase [Rhodococcus erythropolis]MBW0292687.1 uracil-DNA glycosylase [Rhodococcus sp. MH15]MDI9960804.1 uracil-DNA glycosylase family protein [Rhodococcus sp. IEGM 1237]MDN5547061.1 uracil-DNA glycosylase family protein [Rhodococcus sp. (in: high G+C Gram-positive bacteria)]